VRAPELRAVAEPDVTAIAALNDDEAPRVSPLGPEGLAEQLRRCDLALIAEVDGVPAGFVLAVAPGAGYDSVNYRFFEERGSDHLYVDRVVVAAVHRRRGIATRLYEAVEARAAETGRAEVTCEVNVRPSNPGSLAFHRERGFVEVGRQETTGGTITVALLAKPILGVGRR